MTLRDYNNKSKNSSSSLVPLTGQPYEREPLTVDWDQADAERNVAVSQRPRIPAIV